MAVANGYGKVVTSGSVFMYDTGDFYNSYKGQPGTNITTGVGRNYNGYSRTDFSGGMYFETNGYTEVVNIPALGPTTVQSIEIHNEYCGYGCNGNYNCCPNLYNYTGGWMSPIWLPGQTYSYQIIYKCRSGYTNPNFMYHYEYTNTNDYLTEYGVFTTDKQESLGDGWYHAWNTFTTHPFAAKGYTGLWYYQYNVSDKLSIAAVSITPGDTIRPPQQIIPSGTTRSVTQGLLPIVDNSTIDLSTVSFDSNAQMVFDGTDDRILLSNFTNKPLTAITCETIIKPTRPSVGTGTIRGGAISSTNSMYLGIIDSTDGGITFSMHWANQTVSSRVANVNGQIPNNAYSYLVGTYDGTTARAYLNGVEIWSAAQTGNIPDASYYIGTYGGNPVDGVHNFNGYIPIAKMYNRALSSSEIKQNYNKYKTRFNLP